MKTLHYIQSWAVLSILSFSFFSCEQEFTTESMLNSSNSERVIQKTGNSTLDYCGTPLSVNLIAGQTIISGDVTIANDETTLYVTYSTINNWLLKELHLYVGESAMLPVNKSGNPSIGLFPFKETFSPYIDTYTFELPLTDFPDIMTIAAHAVVVQTDESGIIVASETGWGAGTGFAKSWAMKFEYTKQECVVEPPVEECYQTETAWAEGTRYTSTGSWATYTNYSPGTVQIFAGQTIPVGTATFSTLNPDNTITITINLTGGWMLNSETNESVKIQGYNIAPSGNPSIGTFTTYKGTSLVINAPVYTYYGIHLDVALPIDCE